MNKDKKEFVLQDGRKIFVRRPSVEKDLDRMLDFFKDLPAEKRNYLRYDVTQKDPLRRRLEQIDGKDHWRLLAESKGVIVGDGTLDREPFGWTRHVAELRVVVSPKFAGAGVGSILLGELVGLGSEGAVERLFSEIMAEDTERIRQLEEAGFVKEAMRSRWAKDSTGRLHDVLIMSNDLEDSWRRLNDQLMEMHIRLYQED